MSMQSLRHPPWRFSLAAVIAMLCLGTDGCPVQTSCGVYDREQEHPQDTDAHSWTCRATVHLASGTTISSPEAVKVELLARKESTAAQLVALQTELDRLEDRMVALRGGTPDAGTPERAEREELTRRMERLMEEERKIDGLLQQLESIRVPEEAVVLRDGMWTADQSGVTVRAYAPYKADRPAAIPYVIRSREGEILETGLLIPKTITLEPRP